MRDRVIKEIDTTDTELETLCCPNCSKVGLSCVLGNKILMPQEVKQPDYENWLQCPRCAFLCPIYETEPKETIQDTVTTIENPFESAQGQVLGVYKKGIRRKKKRQKHPDKDIELEIKQHGQGQDNVKVIQDTNP